MWFKLKKEITQQRSPQIAKLHIDWLQLNDDCFNRFRCTCMYIL
jgi:hypothetical protein